MPEDSYSFATARVRLEEIVAQVRKKDTSLEKSLDLLEEGVRLANQCTELIDHADWEAAGVSEPGATDDDAGATSSEAAGAPSEAADEATAHAESEAAGGSTDEPDGAGGSDVLDAAQGEPAEHAD